MISITLFYCCEKGVYPYEYMNGLEKFNETSLPEKKKFLQSPKYGRYY